MRDRFCNYLTALFIGLALPPCVAAQTPRYEVTPVPPLETPSRTFVVIDVAGINDSGQVAATAAAGPRRAIRYALGGEVESPRRAYG
jgi:hypothetical protein